MEYPDDFYTDSPVHISKLSDEEFRKRREYLTQIIAKHTEGVTENRFSAWSQEIGDQVLSIIEKRASYSLPLPEPVDVTTFEHKDLIAVFSKMHSRSFARSMRLCKDVNNFLTKNRTKFSIRIREGQLKTANDSRSETESNFLFRRGEYQSSWDLIKDSSSILPFTFAEFMFRRCGVSYGNVDHFTIFDSMKRPFLRQHIDLWDDARIYLKPWMIGVNCLSFEKFRLDGKERRVSMRNWKVAKELNPKELRFSFAFKTIPVAEVLDSSPVVHISQFPNDCWISKIVQEWCSGEWNHKAIFISGNSYEREEILERAVSGCFTFDLDGVKLTFVPNPDNTFLVLKTSVLSSGYVRFSIILDIRLVSDLIPHEEVFLGDLFPIDYSGYNGDIDSVIDPNAFCMLLTNFEPSKYQE